MWIRCARCSLKVIWDVESGTRSLYHVLLVSVACTGTTNHSVQAERPRVALHIRRIKSSRANTHTSPMKAISIMVLVAIAAVAVAKKKGPISTKKKVGKKAVKVKKAIGTGKKAGKK